MRAIVKCDDYASFKLRVNARPHFVNEKQQKHRAIRSGRTMVGWTHYISAQARRKPAYKGLC